MKKATLIEIFDSLQNDNLTSKVKYLQSLNSNLFRLSHSLFLAGVQPKYYQRELEGKVFRFGMANQSILNLANGNNNEMLGIQTQTIDIFSIYSIIRMQIESFTIIFYLMFDEVSEEELNLRYSVYKLAGLLRQSQFQTSTDFGLRKLKGIKTEIDALIEEIKSYDSYKSLSEDEQKKLLNPKFAKLISSDRIMIKAGMDNVRLRDMWKVYSNHLHSEHIGDRQFNTMHKIEKSVDSSLSTVIDLECILTAKLAKLIIQNFDAAKSEFEKLTDEEKTHINLWSRAIAK
jgi:hypothetical protein